MLGITHDPIDRQRELKPEKTVERLKGKEKSYCLFDKNSILYKVNVANEAWAVSPLRHCVMILSHMILTYFLQAR